MTSIPVVPLLVVSGSALALVSLFLWSRRRERGRTEALMHFARTRGFEFEETAENPGLKTWLFQRGRRRHCRNVLKRSEPGFEWTVFDYRFWEHHGNHSHRESQTVAAFRRAGPALPSFELRGENLLHKVAAVFGVRDIDFDSRPEFSGKYLLRGPDERAIREAFGPTVLAFFEKNPGWSVETQGDWIVVYRGGRTVKAEDLAGFLEETKRVVTAVAGAGRG